MGVGGCVWTRHIFYCLTYCSGRHKKFAFITIHNYSGTLFSFRPKILLIMNDFRATVILIRWNKHSNQMEAGPGGLGEGLGRDPRFSLARTLTLDGAGWGKPLLRALHSPGSETPAPPEAPWLPVGLPAAPRVVGRAAPWLSERRSAQSSGPRAAPAAASTRASLLPPQVGAALRGWRLQEKGQLESPRLRGTLRRPGAAPQARGCHPGRAESILASKRGSKEAAAIHCLMPLPTSVSFSISYSFGFQIIGPEERGTELWILETVGKYKYCILLRKDQRQEGRKFGFGVRLCH